MYHTSVLLDESVQSLQIKPKGIYVDGTLGSGGHAKAILESEPTIKLFGFDQDQEAIDYATNRLSAYADRITIIKDNFANIRTQLAWHKVSSIDGILLDLGVSSRQFDSGERGFSFQENYPLDMRMDRQTDYTAKEALNELSLEELTTIIREYGEEKQAYKIAKAIIERRLDKPFETTRELSDIIEKVVKGNPKFIIKSKARVFQAIRIHVNNELGVLTKVMEDALNILNPGGVMSIITFHSLEDRLVKDFFKLQEKDCICPPNFPKCVCDKYSRLKILGKKPIVACEQEIRENSRSRSAKLRVAVKTRWGNGEQN